MEKTSANTMPATEKEVAARLEKVKDAGDQPSTPRSLLTGRAAGA